jgi:hypothetical protein
VECHGSSITAFGEEVDAVPILRTDGHTQIDAPDQTTMLLVDEHVNTSVPVLLLSLRSICLSPRKQLVSAVDQPTTMAEMVGASLASYIVATKFYNGIGDNGHAQ